MSFTTVSELTLETNYIKSLLSRDMLLDILGTSISVTPHHTSHELGGTDPIKLDDLDTPDDNSDLNASILRHGLLRKLDNDTTHFLRGDGTWTIVSGSLIKLDDLATPDDNTDLNATTSAHGLLRKLDNNSLNFLNGQGAWANPVAPVIGQYKYVVYYDGANYIAKRDSWAVESTNSDPVVVLQYAIDNSTHDVVGIKNGWYPFTSKLNMVNKNVNLVGLFNRTVTTAASSNPGFGGVVFKKNYALAEPMVDITNTGFTKNGLMNIMLVGNNSAGDIGCKFYFGRGRALTNVGITGFDTGIEMGNFVNADINSLDVYTNLTRGIYMSFSTSTRINTTRFFGGGVVSNPTNLYVDGSAANDVQFFGTEFEGAATGHVKSVQIESGSNDMSFICCSFEKNGETNPICVYDNGNNNLYYKCRFDSDVSYTPVEFRSSAKNNILMNNFFQTNTASTTATILIDSGASDCSLLFNKKGTNTVGTVVLTDNGTNTRLFGNSQMSIYDKLPKQITFNDFIEQKVITIPANPASGFMRFYPKVIDANNDGIFCLIKKAGVFVEEQII